MTAEIPPYGQALTSYYTEQLCGQADAAYRVAYGLELDATKAWNAVERCYKDAAMHLETADRKKHPLLVLIPKLWELCGTGKSTSGDVEKLLSSLTREQRLILLVTDAVGIGTSELASTMEWDESTIREHLAEARQSLCKFAWSASQREGESE